MTTTLLSGDNCNFCDRAEIKSKENTNIKTKQTVFYNNPPTIIGSYSIVGQKEGEGPVGKYFDKTIIDAKIGEKTFENAEIRMLTDAINGAISAAGIRKNDVDLMISGDLLNQVTSSNYVARSFDSPYLGVYSACSTMTEALNLASTFIDGGKFDTIACSTASHFATAERQYRYPLEYGCQRPPYSQWTVTGAACSILSKSGNGPKITAGVIGKVIDYGTNDLNNMGAAMAPAAMNTMVAMFKETNTLPSDFDLIITGDLGKLGSDILRKLMREQGYNLGKEYIDCGHLIFDGSQMCYQGGSGAACSGTVFNSFVLNRLNSGMYKNVAYFATGALMSTQSCYQGETIPCISHAVIVEGQK